MPTCGYEKCSAWLRCSVAAKRLMAGFRFPLNSKFLPGILDFRVRDPLFPLNSNFLAGSACVAAKGSFASGKPNAAGQLSPKDRSVPVSCECPFSCKPFGDMSPLCVPICRLRAQKALDIGAGEAAVRVRHGDNGRLPAEGIAHCPGCPRCRIPLPLVRFLPGFPCFLRLPCARRGGFAEEHDERYSVGAERLRRLPAPARSSRRRSGA